MASRCRSPLVMSCEEKSLASSSRDTVFSITLDKRKIVVEPIKTTGVYTAKCKLGYEITADLKVEVREL